RLLGRHRRQPGQLGPRTVGQRVHPRPRGRLEPALRVQLGGPSYHEERRLVVSRTPASGQHQLAQSRFQAALTELFGGLAGSSEVAAPSTTNFDVTGRKASTMPTVRLRELSRRLARKSNCAVRTCSSVGVPVGSSIDMPSGNSSLSVSAVTLAIFT